MKIVEKPPRNSAALCGGGQGLSWAVEPRKEEQLKFVPDLKATPCILTMFVAVLQCEHTHYKLMVTKITGVARK